MTQVIRYLDDGRKETVDNNTAFSLIESGKAVLNKNFKDYDNKMMTPKKDKKYKVK